MYLVIDPITRVYVFVEKDPREDGYEGDVHQDVRLDEIGTLYDRSQDSTTPVPYLGRSTSDEKHYRVFECLKDCRAGNFEPVATVYGAYETWTEYQEGQ